MEQHIISSWSFKGNQPAPNQDINSPLIDSFWFHCQRDHPQLRPWLEQNAVPEALIHTLLADDTRPRFESYDEDTFLIILRGINLNQGAEPDDMLSLRLLWYKGSLISTRKISSKAVSTVVAQLEAETGPSTLPELLMAIIQGINSYIAQFLVPIEERLEEIEMSDSSVARELSSTQSRLLKIHRYLKPQKYVLEDLLNAELKVLEKQQFHIKNVLDTVIRINESVEFYLQHIELFFNTMGQRQSEKMNKNSYLLSIIAGIFLPAGFFTGLLGVNIGGIPGTDNPFAFALFCASLVLIVAAEIIVLKKLKFI